MFGEQPGQFDTAPENQAEKTLWRANPCAVCDYDHARELAEQEEPLVGSYTCHMGLTELYMMVTVGRDRANPIVAGQFRAPDADVLGRVERLWDQHPCFYSAEYDAALRALAAGTWGQAKEAVLPTIMGPEHASVAQLFGTLPEGRVVIPDRTEPEIAEIVRRAETLSEAISNIVRARHPTENLLHALEGSVSSIGTATQLLARRWQLHQRDDEQLVQLAGIDAAAARRLDALRTKFGESLERAEEQAHHAASILLRFERTLRAPGLRPLEVVPDWLALGDVLAEATRRFRWRASSRRIHLRHGVGTPEGAHIHADRDHLMTVLDCIYDNAVKYSFAGGRSIDTIWGTGGRDPFGQPAGKSSDASGQPEWLHVKIEDYGHQIKPEERLRIFEAHFQGSSNDPVRDIPGAGLGLAVAKELADAVGLPLAAWCQLFESPMRVPAGKVATGKFICALSFPPGKWAAGKRGAKDTR